MSLRLKLLIAVIALVFAGLLVSDVVTYTSLRSFLIKRVDQQLTASRGPMIMALSGDDQGRIGPFPGGGDRNSELPPGTFGEFRDTAGHVVLKKTITYGEPALPEPAIPSNVGTARAAAKPEPFTAGAVGGSSVRYRVLVTGGFTFLLSNQPAVL